MRALILALCLLASPALAGYVGPARVIDGDTLEIQSQRIRLHGIDAPIEAATLAGAIVPRRNNPQHLATDQRGVLRKSNIPKALPCR